MNRHGSLVWWLVCMGLVLCWVWNFQTAMETEPQEMTALDIKSANQQQPTDQRSGLRLPPVHNPTQSANQIAEELENTEIIQPQQPTQVAPLVQASTFSNPLPENKLPVIDFTERQTSSQPQTITNPAVSVGQTSSPISQPQTLPPIPASEKQSDANRISNPFFNQDTTPSASTPNLDPILTMDQTPATQAQEFVEASQLELTPQQPTSNQHVNTEFPGFEDLEQERAEWNNETHRVTPKDQFVIQRSETEITPILPAGQRLAGNAATIQQCVNHIEYGKSLARRGAAFAARQEFYSALRLIAQTNDVQTRSINYTTALGEAITALKEADDFFSELSHEGIDINVALVIDAHKSKIISKAQAQGMSSMVAIQAYFEFARRRMGDAFGENVIASEALYSLGKLFTVAATHDLTGNPLDYSKSMVMHYAAMDCDQKNYRSANELGVLMARNGRLEKARDLFRSSLVVHQMPQTWRNLAIVHDRLANSSNDPQFVAENRSLAQKAGHEYQVARQSLPSSTPKLQFVTPEQFEQIAPAEFNDIRTAQAQPDPVPSNSQKPNVLDRLKDLF